METIQGETIQFIEPPLTCRKYPSNSIAKEHINQVELEISTLLSRGIIVQCSPEKGDFVSPIFSVPKKDNNVRLILNLKNLNQYIEHKHFKMESIHSALNLVTPNCWMASVDLKDAYYSVKIAEKSQKYLKFTYKGTIYKYTTYPNGLSTCPRNFTKLLKPPLSSLRKKGHIICAYIDDLLLVGGSFDKQK